ncbi:MAG: T9SS C-terminal target domain-containing protein [Balneola sp.]|nr:MAG: T9SS C-terminal target domain-containing protein [Balneola sp.]
MKYLQFLSVLGLLFLISNNPVQAQLFEDFEGAEKASYTGATVSLSSGNWFLDDALLGNLANDKFNGSQGVRMDRRNDRTGNIYMQFDKTDGADEVSFYFANYGSSDDNELQVQYSTDGGSTWENLGDPLAAPSTLEQRTISVAISGNIRFKFIQSAGTDRLNIDDIRITDFVEASDTATIAVTVDDITINDTGTTTFPTTLVGTSREKTLSIKNTGNTQLDISEVTITGQGFSVSSLADSSLAFNESTDLTLTFEPQSAGEAAGSISILNNSENAPSFGVTLSGEGIEDGEIIPISTARDFPLGTRVTVTGRVTVGNEFGGPLYMQDGTAGIAVFWELLHTTAEIGDSVTVTGPLTVFRPIAGNDEDFLLQISDTDDDSNVLFEIIDTEKREVSPRPVNLEQVNSGNYEGQLVVIQNATIDHSGAFQGNQNYGVSDGFADAELRIDNNTNLVGAQAPTEATNIVAAVGKFAGVYQILPRFTADVGVEEVTFPGDSISKDFTLDVVTWNIEWFGDEGNGPADVNTQFENVKTLVTTLDADIYALQEISDVTLFNSLVSDLQDYDGVIADFSQTQRTAYLYNTNSIQFQDSELITSGMVQSDWANGRYPFLLQFTANINGEGREIYAYNIHAKAFGEPSDYSQRLNASGQLKSYLDNTHQGDNVIVLGDFNDEILESTSEGEDSPYKNFDDDTEYTIVTKSLEQAGYTSFSRFSMIDHIVFNSQLSDEYFEGTERVENPFYIGSFLSETSDHFPVWVRFKWGVITSNEDEPSERAYTLRLDQNYPNPFNPTTTISYNLENASQVNLEVFDLMGRRVATLVSERQTAGEQSVSFDASSLSSGVYIYQLTAGGSSLTRKMVLLK